MDSALYEQVKLRPGRPSDLNFILQSWCKSLRCSDTFKKMPSSLYWRKIKDLSTHFLSCKDTVVLCSKDCDDQILAWMCYERLDEPGINTVYFAYTKRPFRKLGAITYLFAQIFGDDPTQYVFSTADAHAAAKRLKAIYNPFQIMR